MSSRTRQLPPPSAHGGQTRSGRLNLMLAYLSEHYAKTLFVVLFLVPTLIAAIYYGFIATDRYVSETRFIVRSVSKPAAEGAAAYLQDFGIVRANDDAFAIQDYILSRDAMHAIMRRIELRKVWTRDGADFWSRYGALEFGDSDEALYRYFRRRIQVEKNLESGITTVRVNAYRPEDAQRIAQLILELSEERVNNMNVRALRDSLATAEQATKEAARNLARASVDLTRYREATQLIDPSQSADATIERSSALEQELAELQVNLQTTLTRAPANPAIPALRQRIAALSAQISAQQGQLTGARSSLAGKLGDYERLEVESELAEKIYEAAQKQLNEARESAQRQQVFIERIAQPSLADEALEPRRLRYIFTVALLSFWAFLIFYLLLSGSREHLNLS